ncbi:MAG: hypothetical protein WC205_00260 [Opitutaceae bacterium]|jgi:hypothetical protein
MEMPAKSDREMVFSSALSDGQNTDVDAPIMAGPQWINFYAGPEVGGWGMTTDRKTAALFQ